MNDKIIASYKKKLIIEHNFFQIDEFIDLVIQWKSKDCETRELAARALLPLLNEENMETVFLTLLDSLSSLEISFNLRHGYAYKYVDTTTIKFKIMNNLFMFWTNYEHFKPLQLFEIIATEYFYKIEVCPEKTKQFL